MPLSVSCPSCGKAANAPDGSAGKIVACPACSHRFTVQDDNGTPHFSPPPVRVPGLMQAVPVPDPQRAVGQQVRSESMRVLRMLSELANIIIWLIAFGVMGLFMLAELPPMDSGPQTEFGFLTRPQQSAAAAGYWFRLTCDVVPVYCIARALTFAIRGLGGISAKI